MLDRLALLRWLLAAALGLAAGALSAWWCTGERGSARVHGHPEWHGDAATGSASAGPYTRARIARNGLLALNRNEAMYYIADRDSEGQALRESCSYEIRGGALPAKWWSLTLYAQDLYLARNRDGAHAVGANGLAVEADGRWRVQVAREREGRDNWLSTRASGDFTLGLRLYRPDAEVIDGAKNPALPTISRLRCATGKTA